MPANEIFVVPQQGSLIFNQITGQRATPFQGDMANAYATNVLRTTAAQTTFAKKIEAIRKAAESKIVYSDAYKPPTQKPKPAVAAAKTAPALPPPAAPAAK